MGGESYEGRQIKGIRINTPTEDGVEKPVFFIESGENYFSIYVLKRVFVFLYSFTIGNNAD